MPSSLSTKRRWAAAATLGLVSCGPAWAQPGDAGMPEDAAAEAAAHEAVEAFIGAWNTGDDVYVRDAMSFPFVTVGANGTLVIAQEPADFVQGFDALREREGWVRSTFDLDSVRVTASSPEKVHLDLGFTRYRTGGEAYATSRVFYVVTRQDDGWGLQLRTRALGASPVGATERDAIIEEARAAVLDFFTAFNTSDAEGTVATLNHPHVFMTPGGGFAVAETAADGPRPDFDGMRARENWHMSTIDALEASVVTRDKVHFDLVFTRWHPDGTRYWTVPALWIVTKAGDHWGIQVRSLLPATLDDRN